MRKQRLLKPSMRLSIILKGRKTLGKVVKKVSDVLSYMGPMFTTSF
ncbi:hypothetical protein EDB55_0412 [Vibrio crassostreae]|nr:hypothetical protein EDB55_0412 [Vibrio crassostreae]